MPNRAMADLFRHILRCNQAPDPSSMVPFRIGQARVGWLGHDAARVLTFFPQHVHFDQHGARLSARNREGALAALAEAMVQAGIARKLRGELYDVREQPEGRVLARLDRGAVPAFGVRAEGVHLNGFQRRADGLHLWVATRARDKAVAPGQFDHIVAGGVPAGLTPEQTLLKEAEEEASIPAGLAVRAVAVGRIAYAMAVEDGLRVDLLHCYDLELPEDFSPRPNDDEVEGFALWPIARVLDSVRTTDDWKFNVPLVLIDLFLRHGLIDPQGAEGRRLRAGLAA
jgi:8-oxo-dGTP pyrophosphatase MutT (NUDIX family)